MKVREVIRLLQQDGWRHVRTRGSHRQFQHPVKAGIVTGYTQQHSQELRTEEGLEDGSWNTSVWVKRASPVTGRMFPIYRDASQSANLAAKYSSSFAKPLSFTSRRYG